MLDWFHTRLCLNFMTHFMILHSTFFHKQPQWLIDRICSNINAHYSWKLAKDQPNAGLEPATLRLRVSCSTDWASRAYIMLQYFQPVSHSFLVSTAKLSYNQLHDIAGDQLRWIICQVQGQLFIICQGFWGVRGFSYLFLLHLLLLLITALFNRSSFLFILFFFSFVVTRVYTILIILSLGALTERREFGTGNLWRLKWGWY